MRLKIICESGVYRYGYDEYYIELMIVGPKSKGQSRKYYEYVLPHQYHTVNFDLIDNPVYFDKVVVYDITHDSIAPPATQKLKEVFLKNKIHHLEMGIEYKWDYYREIHKPMFGGQEVKNAQSKTEEGYDINFERLTLYGISDDGIRVNKSFGNEIFEDYRNKINLN